MPTVTIIGDGRVGRALAAAFRDTEFLVEALVSRHSGRPSVGGLSPVGVGSIERIASDVVVIATQDREIAGAAAEIGPKLNEETVVIHTSGVLSSDELAAVRERGCRTASLHPLVSVTERAAETSPFRGAYFCIEGDEPAVVLATQIAGELGGRPFHIDTAEKPLYHAAAVTACGHIVALIDIAAEMLAKCGVPQADALTTLMPLIESTIANLRDSSTADALTGPFARADADTVARNLSAIRSAMPASSADIYAALGLRSLDLAALNGVPAERIREVVEKMAVARSR